MGHDSFDRRTVLRGFAGVLGASALAGCSAGGSSNDGNSTNSSGNGNETTDSQPSTTGTGNSTATETSSIPKKAKQWLAGANSYDGSVADMIGKSTVQVAVGAGKNGFAFDPAAIRVSPGTTVRWTWVGGAHNVVAKDGAFNSGAIQTGSDVVYEATLDQSGTHLYYCQPHRRLGMKGAVFVGNA